MAGATVATALKAEPQAAEVEKQDWRKTEAGATAAMALKVEPQAVEVEGRA